MRTNHTGSRKTGRLMPVVRPSALHNIHPKKPSWASNIELVGLVNSQLESLCRRSANSFTTVSNNLVYCHPPVHNALRITISVCLTGWSSGVSDVFFDTSRTVTATMSCRVHCPKACVPVWCYSHRASDCCKATGLNTLEWGVASRRVCRALAAAVVHRRCDDTGKPTIGHWSRRAHTTTLTLGVTYIEAHRPPT